MFFLQSTVFLLSTILILSLSYLKVSNSVFQQITAFLLAVTLIFVSRIVFPKAQFLKGKALRLLLLFLSAALVQFLVISTGGFYSPFLIMLHLYTLGASFLTSSRSPISFLVFAALALGVNVYTNPQLLGMFKNDPGPVVLYSISFLVIIPIAHFLLYTYHLKDSLFKAIKEYARISEKREGSILTALSEMVLVTDADFNIISISDAVEKNLKIPQDGIIGQKLLNILPVKDSSNKLLDTKNLVPQLTENVSTIINNLYLKDKKVAVQVRPVADSKGQISQIVFIIANPAFTQVEKHSGLMAARQKHKLLARDLRQTLLRANLPDSAAKIGLLEKIEEDLQLAAEMEDHPAPQAVDSYDIAYIAKNATLSKQGLASSLGLSLQFEISQDYPSEKAMLDLIDSNISKQQLPVSDFAVITNNKSAETIINKLIDIAMLLSSEKKGSKITVVPELSNTTNINISFPYRNFSEKEKEELFQEYYGNLAISTNLHLGSGLEGFIAKTVIKQLNIPLKITYQQYFHLLTFILSFTKTPSSHI